MAKPRSAGRGHPRDNRLLAALPDADYAALAPHLDEIAMPLGLAVCESGGRQGFVVFPADSIVSLLYVLEDGASTEIAVTGNEGLAGISLELRMTQELIANMVGVRREGVTGAASALQRRGLIGCRRGGIRILERAGLEAAACGCYAPVLQCTDARREPVHTAP